MGNKYQTIPEKIKTFIYEQKIFFVSTATQNSYINTSPKEIACLKIINDNQVLWLNKNGNGNESAAHMQENGKMTLMFCSFTQKPFIVRLYGKALEIRQNHDNYPLFIKKFNNTTGARQIFLLNIDLVHISCGFGVPLFDYVGERKTLDNWAEKKGDSGLKQYQQTNNTTSLNDKKIIIS